MELYVFQKVYKYISDVKIMTQSRLPKATEEIGHIRNFFFSSRVQDIQNLSKRDGRAAQNIPKFHY